MQIRGVIIALICLKIPLWKFHLFYQELKQKRKAWSFDPLNFVCKDLSKLDLSSRYNDLKYAEFNTSTVWPDKSKLPKKFKPEKIMEVGKNPGLGLKKLHLQGINGKDVSIAIIDQTLLLSHVEYQRFSD